MSSLLQFLRNFPVGNNQILNEDDWKAIANKYRHPEKKEMIRYMLWRLDQDMLVAQLRGDVANNKKSYHVPQMVGAFLLLLFFPASIVIFYRTMQ